MSLHRPTYSNPFTWAADSGTAAVAASINLFSRTCVSVLMKYICLFRRQKPVWIKMHPGLPKVSFPYIRLQMWFLS